MDIVAATAEAGKALRLSPDLVQTVWDGVSKVVTSQLKSGKVWFLRSASLRCREPLFDETRSVSIEIGCSRRSHQLHVRNRELLFRMLGHSLLLAQECTRLCLKEVAQSQHPRVQVKNRVRLVAFAASVS
jgi:hypothetical protein